MRLLVRVCAIFVVCIFCDFQRAGAEPVERATSGEMAVVPSVSPRARKVVESARGAVGKEMWKRGFGLRDGRLGCAASVSNVLKQAGVSRVYSPVTKYMRKQILEHAAPVEQLTLKSAGQPISAARLREARPGDVVVAFMRPLPVANIGPSAHCGIMSDGDRVYTNDWNNGKWTHGNIHTYFDGYNHIYLLRFK